jgi:hypothetical protein
MGFLLKTFPALVLTFLLLGCGSSLFDYEEPDPEQVIRGQVSDLLVVPVRREYRLEDDTFAKTDEHLSVFAVLASGTTRRLPLELIAVSLGERPVTEEGLSFESSGDTTVTVSYAEKNACYSVMVRSGSDVGGYPFPPGSDDGTAVDIGFKWK